MDPGFNPLPDKTHLKTKREAMPTAVKRKQEKSQPKDRKKLKVDAQKSASRGTKRAPPPAAEPGEDSKGGLDDHYSSEEEFAGFADGRDDADGRNMPDMDEPSRPAGAKSAEEVAKAKESRQEKKRQAVKRRQGKPLGDVIYQSKKIWEQIRRKDLSKEERKRKIEEHQEMIRGNVKDLVFKHDASRVVQTALKYGSKSIREEIAQELKGTFVQLAQSSYGKYLVVKVMHYGTPETKKMVVEEFCGHVQKLIKHREASFVIEDCFREFGTPEQKARLVREFYGAEFTVFAKDRDSDPSLKKILEKSPEKRAVIMKNIFGLLKAVVEKGALFFTIVHKAMLEFISNTTPGTTEATEFIELVKEHAGEISFTKDGSQVIMRCLALGNAKDRKAMIKSLKPVADQVAAHESGHLVLLTLFDVLDDTVLVSKSIIAELQRHLFDLAIHNFGRTPLLYPFVGRKTRLLSPPDIKSIQEMDPIREATSKKEPEQRQLELRSHLSPLVLEGIVNHADVLVQSSFGCQFITEVLLGAVGDKAAATKVIADLAAGNPNENDHVASTAAGGRMLKTLVAGGHYNNREKKVETIDPPLNFHTPLYQVIKDNLKEWAAGAGSFVVVGLLETKGFGKKAELKQTLNTFPSEIRAAADSGNKGSKVIVEKLE